MLISFLFSCCVLAEVRTYLPPSGISACSCKTCLLVVVLLKTVCTECWSLLGCKKLLFSFFLPFLDKDPALHWKWKKDCLLFCRYMFFLAHSKSCRSAYIFFPFLVICQVSLLAPIISVQLSFSPLNFLFVFVSLSCKPYFLCDTILVLFPLMFGLVFQLGCLQ